MTAMMAYLRPLARRALATTAVLSFIFVGLSLFITLAAGTLQMDGGYPDGPGYLAFSSLSVVRFKGLFVHPNDNGSQSYQITLHWFLNAFGWEWPWTSWDRSCGIVTSINGVEPGPALTLPGDLVTAARRLRFPEEEYWCFNTDPSARGGICHSQFFDAWYEAKPPTTSFSTVVPLLGFYFAGIIVLSAGVIEVMVRWTPNLLKCQCPGFISKRGLCPCLKDGEEMTAGVRYRHRVWNLVLLAMAYGFSSLALLRKGLQVKAYVDEVDTKVGGMNAQIGHGFLWMSGATLIAVLVSIACLTMRARIEPTKSWMAEQGISGDAVSLDQPKDGQSEDVDAPL